ncbi:hypothetical protein [Salinispora oceanensis]|uniref:hypothetical protein n=1 Tax=Salinispora oceanensis TaxID=1050199 RepID=UPI00038089DB|nr:hypothetical protein [Salinispora oceanensis]
MNHADLRSLMERAVEAYEVPGDFAARVVRGTRARRRRRQGVVVGLSLLVVAVGGLGVAKADLGQRAPIANQATPPEPDLDEAARRLSRDTGSVVTAQQVLAAGRAGDEDLVLVKRSARPEEAAAGGKAAELWVATGSGKFSRSSDYISYDLACVDGDAVCPVERPTGLGVLVVRHLPGRGSYVFVAVAAGRQVEVTTVEGQTSAAPGNPYGTVVKVETAEPWRIRVRVELPDTKAYELPLPPGGVITD